MYMTAREQHNAGTPYETLSNKMQVTGFTSANIVEVETNNKAVRMLYRAPDVLPGFGRYSIARTLDYGNQTAAVSGAVIFSFVWNDNRTMAAIRKVSCSYQIGTMTANLAGVAFYTMVRSRNYASVSGTIFTSGGLGNGVGPLSSKFQEPFALLVTNQSWNTAVGTRSADSNPVGTRIGSVKAALAGQSCIPFGPIYETQPGEIPLLLADNMGFDLLLTAPGATTAMDSVVNYTVQWDELPLDAYNY